jgi:signal transduction histidine kinase
MSAEPVLMREHVALLAPTAADADIARTVLRQAGIASTALARIDELCEAIEEGVGAVVLLEEVLSDSVIDALQKVLAREPTWSRTPFIILTRPASAAREVIAKVNSLPGALLVERPVRIVNLLSAVRSSLDARHRQYAMRDLLEESRRSAVQRAELLQRAEESARHAETANRMKDEFLAVLSHELRTPLNAILGWAALLRGGTLTPEQTARAIESVERNSRLQAQLIEDLLDVSRVISGSFSLDLQPVRLDAIVAEAIATVMPASVAKGVTLLPPANTVATCVRGDPARLQQIVWNLLTNAIKFTTRGGSVRVEIEVSDGVAQLSVTDTGEGIDAHFLPHVFERFRQADSSTTR